MSYDDEVVRVLSHEQCWDLLSDDEFGRLAFRMADEVHLVPVNYAVDGDTLLFRTAEGDEELRADDIGLRPWLGTLKYNVVEIRPTAISGRAFRLEP